MVPVGSVLFRTSLGLPGTTGLESVTPGVAVLGVRRLTPEGGMPGTELDPFGAPKAPVVSPVPGAPEPIDPEAPGLPADPAELPAAAPPAEPEAFPPADPAAPPEPPEPPAAPAAYALPNSSSALDFGTGVVSVLSLSRLHPDTLSAKAAASGTRIHLLVVMALSFKADKSHSAIIAPSYTIRPLASPNRAWDMAVTKIA